MTVDKMISLMRTLGIGEVFNDNDSKRIALDYLNLANDELYRETANVNSKIFEKSTKTSVAGETSITLDSEPFSVIKVLSLASKRFLQPRSVIDFDTYMVQNTYFGYPRIYSNLGAIVNFYPIVAGTAYTFDIWSSKKRTLIDETMPESEIPYPSEYHGILVDGALYYMFHDEAGFKNTAKENESLRRWLNGKVNLTSYLYGSGRQYISTFENA